MGVGRSLPSCPLAIHLNSDYAVKTFERRGGAMPGKLCRIGRTRAVAVVLVLLAGGLAAHAQPPAAFLVKDLDSVSHYTASRSPLAQAALGGWVYFSAHDPQHGS